MDDAGSLEAARPLAKWALGGLCVLLLVLALVSIVPSDQWFIRALDMVREPMLYLALILLAASALIAKWRWQLIAGFAVVTAIHIVRIWPYFAIAPAQTELSEATSDECFTVLALNVKMKNQEFTKVARLIDRTKPDMLLLMEPDAKWADQLAAQLGRYSYRLSRPQSNAYGMIFASNLPVRSARMVSNTEANTPTLYATIEARAGATFEFIGLHPRPPIPGQDTRKRDANIARAGTNTPDGLADALVMGDFNDVPWSRTTATFREKGKWLDPRIGRGTFPTFPASYAFVGWPLDQLMTKNQMDVASFERMENVGSDHLPMRARVCLRQ